MATEKKRVLGRGLESLIPAARQTAPVVREIPREAGESVREIRVDEIEPSPYQPRRHKDEAALKELSESIRVSGVMQPILVREVSAGMTRFAGTENNPTAKDGKEREATAFTTGDAGVRSSETAVSLIDVLPGQQRRPEIDPAKVKYQLIAGERRWLASMLAGKETIPALVRKISNEEAAEQSLIENLQREDLNPIEMAYAFARLASEFGLTQEQIAARTGKDRATVANHLRLLKMPADAQGFLAMGRISFGHAKVLMSLPDQQSMEAVLTRVLTDGLSVRQTEELTKKHMWGETASVPTHGDSSPQVKWRDPNVKDAERRLREALGLRVDVKDKHGRGKVVIEYRTLEDFERIIEALGK